MNNENFSFSEEEVSNEVEKTDLAELEQNSIYVDNKFYVDLKYFTENPEFVINNAEFLEEEELQPRRMKPQEEISSRSNDKQKFKWEITQQTVFAVVVTGLGINAARPKQILPLMPERYNLDEQMIASHLEKYREKIIKDFNLQNMTEIENFMYPEALSEPILVEISSRWRTDTLFEGLSEAEIKIIVSRLM